MDKPMKDAKDYLFHYLSFWAMYSLNCQCNEGYIKKRKELKSFSKKLIAEMENKVFNSAPFNYFLKSRGVPSVYAGY